jgi:hypothetical protein
MSEEFNLAEALSRAGKGSDECAKIVLATTKHVPVPRDTQVRLALAFSKGHLDRDNGYAIIEEAPWIFHNPSEVVKLLRNGDIPEQYLLPMMNY